MKVGALSGPVTRVSGKSNEMKSRGLSKKERQAVRELQQAWLNIALQVIDTESLAPPLALGIASAGRGEGKTSNCLGLATAMARETEARVLVVECDFESASIATRLEVAPGPGLAEHLLDGTPISEALRPTSLPNLEVLVAGGKQRPSRSEWESWEDEALSSLRRRFCPILESLKQQHAYVLVDLPPLSNNAYAQDIVRMLDGTLLVAREGVTTLQSIADSVNVIGKDRLLSVLLLGGASPLPSWLVRLLPE